MVEKYSAQNIKYQTKENQQISCINILKKNQKRLEFASDLVPI